MTNLHLSDEAYRVICGLVQPSDVIDADEVQATNETWAEIRTVFEYVDEALRSANIHLKAERAGEDGVKVEVQR